MKKDELFNEEITSNNANPSDTTPAQFLDEGNFDDAQGGAGDAPPQTGQDQDGDIQTGRPDDDDFGTVEPSGMEDLFPEPYDDSADFPTNDPAFDDITPTAADQEAIDQANQGAEQKPNQPQVDPELKALNEKLGTTYASMEDLKKALAGETPAAEIPTELPKEKIEQYEKNNRNINFLSTEKAKTDKDLVRDYLLRQERTRNNGQIDEDEVDRIENKIETMDLNGTLDLRAEGIREKIDGTINSLQGQNNGIEQERKNLLIKRSEQLLNNVQDHMVSLSNNDFYGVKLEKDKVLNAYNDIKTNKFFERIEKDPKLMTELALFLEYRDVIQKKASGPGYSEGVRAVVSELETGQDQNLQVSKGTTGHGTSKSLVSRFVD